MPPSFEPRRPTATPKKGMGEGVWDVLLDLIPEAITTVGLLAIVALSHWLIESWMREGAKFFGYVPVEWVFDAGT